MWAPVLSPYDNLRLGLLLFSPWIRLGLPYFLHEGQKCGPPCLLHNDDLTLSLLLFSPCRTQMWSLCLSHHDDPRLCLLVFFLHGAYELEPPVYLIMTPLPWLLFSMEDMIVLPVLVF